MRQSDIKALSLQRFWQNGHFGKVFAEEKPINNK